MVFLIAAQFTVPCNVHPVYSLVAQIGKTAIAREDGGYRASAKVAFRIHEVSGATIVSVEPGLLEHVRGHQIVAERVARSAGGSVDANGSTAAQAKARLSTVLRELTADQNRELAREEQAYDNVTQNGAAQSQGPAYGFPGGPDIQDAACTR